MARITWDQVAAPDLTDAMQSQQIAANLLTGAVKNIDSAFTGLDQIGRDKASAAAMTRAMQIQDPAIWDKMMAEQGIAGLGISADRATPELMQLVQGRGATLDANAKAAYEFERARQEAGRADQALAIKNEATRLANQIGYVAYTPEEAQREMIRATEGNPELRAAGLEALSGVSSLAYTPSQGVKLDPTTNKRLTTLGQTFQQQEDELNVKYGANIGLRLMNQGLRDYSGSNGSPLEGLIQKMTKASQGVGENETEVISDKAGQLTSKYNDLVSKYPDLPPEFIAAAMAQNFEDSGWVFTNDKIEPAMGKTVALLDKVNTEKARRDLYIARDAIAVERSVIDSTRAEMARIKSRLELAKDRGDTKEQAKLEAELIALEAPFAAKGKEDLAAARNWGLNMGQGGPLETGTPSPDPGAQRAADELAKAAGEEPASTAPATALTPEERIAQSNSTIGNFLSGLWDATKNTVYNANEIADAGLGMASGSIVAPASDGVAAAARGVGYFSKDLGASMLSAADRMQKFADSSWDTGLVTPGRVTWNMTEEEKQAAAARDAVPGADVSLPSGAVLDPEKVNAEVARVSQARRANPQNASVNGRIESTIASAARDPSSTVKVVLQSSSIPPALSETAMQIVQALQSGLGDTASKKALQGELKKILDLVRKDYPSNTGDDVLVKALLDNPEKWLWGQN